MKPVAKCWMVVIIGDGSLLLLCSDIQSAEEQICEPTSIPAYNVV